MKTKQLPEDFVVEEIISIPKGGGEQTYFWLTKKNWTTEAAIREVSRRLGISGRRFKFAGSKDRIAVTKQLVSVFKVPKERLENLSIKDIQIQIAGQGDAPISLGTLKGNRFEITARDLAKKDLEKLKKNLPAAKNKGFRNYFGEQRFGFGNTHLIGKAILQGDLKGAVKELLKQKEFRLEKSVALWLERQPSDFAGALRTLPKHIRKLYVHAYQSYLWNSALEKLSTPKGKLPVPGFKTKLSRDKFSKEIKKLLEKDFLSLESFLCRRMPELAVEGDKRQAIVKPKKLKAFPEETDELNKSKSKVLLKFELPKGCYATVLLKFLFS
jgi:tRNA pseudouridine13 synthase